MLPSMDGEIDARHLKDELSQANTRPPAHNWTATPGSVAARQCSSTSPIASVSTRRRTPPLDRSRSRSLFAPIPTPSRLRASKLVVELGYRRRSPHLCRYRGQDLRTGKPP